MDYPLTKEGQIRRNIDYKEDNLGKDKDFYIRLFDCKLTNLKAYIEKYVDPEDKNIVEWLIVFYKSELTDFNLDENLKFDYKMNEIEIETIECKDKKDLISKCVKILDSNDYKFYSDING